MVHQTHCLTSPFKLMQVVKEHQFVNKKLMLRTRYNHEYQEKQMERNLDGQRKPHSERYVNARQQHHNTRNPSEQYHNP